MDILKFAIIGCGRIAARHAEHISNNGTLTAVCDVEISRAKVLGNKYSAKVSNPPCWAGIPRIPRIIIEFLT